MIVTTTDSVPGHSIKAYKGLVWASSARSKHVGHDLASVLRSLVGGELPAYKQLLNEGRADVVRGLVENAKTAGANAVVGMRFGSTQILPAAIDLFAYGTAVVVEKERKK